MLNQLTTSLRDLCAQYPSAEKWLLAPSYRVGQQWVEAVARAGQPVLNVHLESFRSLALLLATPEAHDLRFLSGVVRDVLIARLFARLAAGGKGYLFAQTPSPGLIRALAATLSDLRLAGLSPKQLAQKHFEVSVKGKELAALLAAYEEELKASGQVDYAAVLHLATTRVRTEPEAVPDGVLLLLPEDLARELSPLERALWEAIPGERRLIPKTDRPGEAPEGPLTDAALLRWIATPADAPEPRQDGTATIFRAVGEVNEVREALARCLANGLPLDDVEILYTDSATYLPLLYEFASRLWGEAGALPITFVEGVPVRYSRPARALLGWLTWIREGFSQPALTHLVQDGLLNFSGPEDPGVSLSRLAALLRGIPIGQGRERTLAVLADELKALARRAPTEAEGEGEEDLSEYALRHRERAAGLTRLHATLTALFADLPEKLSPPALLTAAISFLTQHAHCASKLDEYSRALLLDEMRALQECLGEEPIPGLEVGEWLGELAQTLAVEAQGPRPGCLYAAPLAQGGHSGRGHTFLLGLDDGRFPGAGTQDPLLLDGERGRLSRDLPTAASRLSRRVQQLSDLLARVRGQVTLSYCCRDVRDDRATFPSSAVWSAYRILSGEHEGDQEAMLKWLPEPALSFAPYTAAGCLEGADWWLWRLCGEETLADPEGALSACFPALGRGFLARRARQSELFTEYDGYVPEAGAAADPCAHASVVLSASRLETMGRCPFEYFLKYVLEVQPPEEPLDPNVWLNPAERGALLHDLFREFMETLAQTEGRPSLARDLPALEQLVRNRIEAWERERPPHNQEAHARECEELHRVARVFLQEEERHCLGHQPVAFEAGIGVPARGAPGLLDTERTLKFRLPGGSFVHARGLLDRVDLCTDGAEQTYVIWDYKTGSSRRYDRSDPFQQGRHLQNALYLALAQTRLEEVRPGAKVASFGYFFPTLRSFGERIQWRVEELAGGPAIIGTLCSLIAAGCFPFSNDESDVRYSDYADAYGEVVAAARASDRKLQNSDNAMLAPFRALRGCEGGD